MHRKCPIWAGRGGRFWLSTVTTLYPDLHFLWFFLYCIVDILLTSLKIFFVGGVWVKGEKKDRKRRETGKERKDEVTAAQTGHCSTSVIFRLTYCSLTSIIEGIWVSVESMSINLPSLRNARLSGALPTSNNWILLEFWYLSMQLLEQWSPVFLRIWTVRKTQTHFLA